MKHTKWLWVILLLILVIGGGLLLTTKAKNSYLLTTQKNTASPSQVPAETIYTNQQNGFQISYPGDWVVRTWDGGAAFRPKDKPNDYQYEYISLAVLPKPGNIVGLPFDQYVKVAAINEIQNYQSLASIKPFTTVDGTVGYITTWMVQPLGGGKLTESLPIAYLPALQKENSIQVSLSNKDYLITYTKMLSTFHYTK